MRKRPRTIDLAHVRAFVQVTETGSISRAAPGLGYSQPGLSQRIQAFERCVGARLLDRGADGVEPTPAGATALPYARMLLAIADTMRDQIDADRQRPPSAD
jgi:LysR family transcriptional regulator, benzoate and cis,cis-muconate-responsive activator of ben and cat genes